MDMVTGLALLMVLAMTGGAIYAFITGWPEGPGRDEDK